MNNTYHILSYCPSYEADAIAPELEVMAQRLVSSGRLRISADNERNFVKYSGPGFDKSYSKRQLTDPKLMIPVRAEIADTVPYAAGERGIDEVMQRLQREFKRVTDISPQREMQIARLVVQAADPCVIMLLILEQVNVFVSYSHSIADLMGVHFWENEGQSGGMQMISGDGTAVYVSCGGNPFITKEEQKSFVTDGFPALARLMVIAGQELGHYADILRDHYGNKIGRHSAYLQPLRATPATRAARLADIQQVQTLQHQIAALGLMQVVEAERKLGFYGKHRPAQAWWQRRMVARLKQRVMDRAKRHNIAMVPTFPDDLYGSDLWATNLLSCLRDMQFNLMPDAEVYRRADPVEEEAIACIEAIARVPQQAIKWGHKPTQLAWPNLYQIYYDQIISANARAVERITGQRPHFTLSPPPMKRSGYRLRNTMKKWLKIVP